MGYIKIEKVKGIGLCLGVKRAIKQLEEAVHQYGSLETLGPVAHNRQVVDSLVRLGIKPAKGLEEVKSNAVVIPTHGTGPQVIKEAKERGLQIIDVTCPIVRKAQRSAKELAEAGLWIIAFGDKEHSEVKGILDWAGGRGIATLDAKEALRLKKNFPRLGVLSQTTQNPEYFARFLNEVFASISPKVKELRIVNTICDTTRRRQTETLKLARRVDLMIVVGGRDSANTRRLVEICSSVGIETYHIEAASEIKEARLKGHWLIGITAGTSTPEATIEEVVLKLEGMRLDTEGSLI